MTRPANVQINLTALRQNFSRVKQLAPASRILSIVKADAYGHGLTTVSRALDQSDAFGVACIEEAMALRDSGIKSPILLLEGPFSFEELTIVGALELDVVIHNHEQIKMLEQFQSDYVLSVWLKIDTGMHRLGFDLEEVQEIYNKFQSMPNIQEEVILMSHLADAGNTESDMTILQLDRFLKATEGLDGKRSIANSAGIMTHADSHYDVVRPGLMLYGISPLKDRISHELDLIPVMTLQSKLISIKKVKKGEPVGYGATWRCPETMPVGIVAIGYGDGYPRHAGSGTPVMVKGQQTQVIGNPSMDMITVDLRKVTDVSVGDPVELWGVNLPVEKVADYAGTIPYELVSGVHKRLNVTINEPG